MSDPSADATDRGGQPVDTRADLRAAGQAVQAALGHGTNPPRVRPLHLGSVWGLEHYTSEALWGSVWARPGLDRRTRVLCTLSVLTSLQRLSQLRTYLNSALNIGIELAEIEEVLVQCSVQAGFPTTVNALELLRDVLEARGRPVSADRTTVADEPEVGLDQLADRGRALAARLFGSATTETDTDTGGPADPAQALARVHERYVLGQIYLRPGLDLVTRVLCTVAALTALGLVDEVARWAGAAARLGRDRAAVEEVVVQCAYYAGFPAAERALAAVREAADPA
jgi:4-carboxymuconolactone decarboxylase